jgi:hypothetical protein
MRVILTDFISDEHLAVSTENSDSSPLADDSTYVLPVAVVRGIRFEVWDSGSGLRGIDPKTLFEPFSQGKLRVSRPGFMCYDHVEHLLQASPYQLPPRSRLRYACMSTAELHSPHALLFAIA